MNIDELYEAALNVANWKDDLGKITKILENPATF